MVSQYFIYIVQTRQKYKYYYDVLLYNHKHVSGEIFRKNILTFECFTRACALLIITGCPQKSRARINNYMYTL